MASFARPEAAGDGSLNAARRTGLVLRPEPGRITLKTLFGLNPDPDGTATFDGPDNITVSPHGGLILAEDGEGINHLFGVTGGTHRTRWPATSTTQNGEFCGPSFSLDGTDLVHQHPVPDPRSHLAITGPWHRR